MSKPFHRKRNRLEGYDYSTGGAYFITICTHEMQYLFGDVEDGKMMCNYIGDIAHDMRENISQIYLDVQLCEFIVMPNHVHGIIVLPDYGKIDISRIVKGYKWACTKEIRKTDISFFWQKSFHDHIIRNQKEYEQIAYYIKNNPEKRQEDKFYI